MYTVQDIRTFLGEGNIQITFTKRNGTTRILNALCWRDIPTPQPENEPSNKPADLITVWEIDVGWRALYAESVSLIVPI